MIVLQNKESTFSQGIRTKWLTIRGFFWDVEETSWNVHNMENKEWVMIRGRGREGSKVVQERLHLQESSLNVKGGTVPHNVVLNQNEMKRISMKIYNSFGLDRIKAKD